MTGKDKTGDKRGMRDGKEVAESQVEREVISFAPGTQFSEILLDLCWMVEQVLDQVNNRDERKSCS